MMPLLELTSVSKKFGEKQVLDNLSFSVQENTIFGFIGKNGAGKTTTMKLILGLLKKDVGEIKVNNQIVQYGQTTTNRLIGYLPDVPVFYDDLTAKEYLYLCGEITGMSKSNSRKRVQELLTLVDLYQQADKRIKTFSRGMKQRLGIAQALLNEPKLLICDEPTSALDPIGRRKILDILLQAKEQTTILFSTHILSDVEQICDEVAFLNDGEIVLSGTVEELKTHTKKSGFVVRFSSVKHLSAFSTVLPGGTIQNETLVYSDPEEIFQAMALAAQYRIPIQSIHRLEPTVEMLFMEVAKK